MSRHQFNTLLTAALFIANLALSSLPAFAEVTRQDNGNIAKELQTPVYFWQDNSHKPTAIVLAIHGLALHGTVFDSMARHLAARHMIVAAPDLRGYGKWCQRDKPKNAEYKESEVDLLALAKKLRARYRNLPLFVAGESLGASLAIKMAAKHPDIIDGLILSAPAVRHQHHVPLRTIADATRVLTNPTYKVDVSGFIRYYYSEDPAVNTEELNDPLIRKNMSLGELLASCRVISSAAYCIDQIPANMPILIMQGKKDRMVKLSSVDELEHKLKSTNQTVRWFPERGHILLETAHVGPDTLEAVTSWLETHCVMRTAEGASVALAR